MKVNTKLITLERVRRGWTKGDLGRRIDRSVSTVWRIESGRYAPPKVLKEVADLLDIPMEKLIQE